MRPRPAAGPGARAVAVSVRAGTVSAAGAANARAGVARLLPWLLAALALALVLSHPAAAIDAEHLPDPVLEARYQGLIHELRCVQCEDSTLADSDAPIAADVRREIRGMLLAGRTDQEIRDFYVSRYSEFILFKPRWSLRNAWLWGLPAVLLGIGAVVALRILKARAALVDRDDDPLESRP